MQGPSHDVSPGNCRRRRLVNHLNFVCSNIEREIYDETTVKMSNSEACWTDVEKRYDSSTPH